MWKYAKQFFFIVMLLLPGFSLHAQADSIKENRLDSLLMNRKGLLGQLAQSILVGQKDEKGLQRADIPFLKYEDRIIRKIFVSPLDFGVSITDTTKRLSNKLIRLANNLHYQTRPFVIHNYLFFKEGDRLSPYLLGNNERYLRDLPFLQEASILVMPLKTSSDSVDVFVLTKDILSISAGLAMPNEKSALTELKEDNFFGWGDRLKVQTLFDKSRRLPFGYGLEYIKRNIGGSFIDASAGYLNFNSAFNSGRREEAMTFFRLIRPLTDPYMLWTYALTAEFHSTDNMYISDSVYKQNFKYKYRIYDAWAGWNLSSKNIGSPNENNRLRYLLGLRVFDKKFLTTPVLYDSLYNYNFTNLSAVLGSVSVFKQNFFKTQYIYGFGRKEDLPQGVEASLTAGYTKKEARKRPYAGLNFAINYVTPNEDYFNYSVAAGASFFDKKPQDINFLANIDFFSRLHLWGKKWKHRAFLNASFGRQYNHSLDEPLVLESSYGLQNFRNNYRGGEMRASVKAESVFFSPWTFLFFKFAPFVFGSATVFRLNTESPSKEQLFPAFGGGLRTRNESLVFGTIELRAIYFPQKDIFNNGYLIQLNTNIRFKYNQNFIRRPEFVKIN